MRTATLLLACAARAALALGALGCDTEAYCFDCPATSTSGGNGGATAGTGGGSIVPPDGTGGVVINDCGADLENDPLNCGLCDFVCAIPNAYPKCEERFCVIDRCALGFYDEDGRVENGCEYECEPLRDANGDPVEEEQSCDGLDDDCDGESDEIFDLEADVAHCGGCNEACAAPPNALMKCEAGTCAFDRCVASYEDSNDDITPASIEAGTTDGCECNVIGLELCNFVDDDCDGDVDEGINLTTDPDNCGACGNDCGELFPNGTTTCADSLCVFGACLPGFYDIDGELLNGCEYACSPATPGVELCDGEDNDCNGFTDDAPTDVGDACGATVGECEEGIERCIAGVPTCVGDIGPAPELCDGLDNDCDGEGTNAVDEGCPVRGTPVRLDGGTTRGQYSSAQLTVAARGETVFAAWLDRRNGNPDIFFNYSTDGGVTWRNTDLAVANTNNQEIEPWLFTSRSRVYAAFGRFSGGNPRRIHFSVDELVPDGWAAARLVEVAANGADSFFARGIVANDVASSASDQLVIVWQTLNGTNRDIYLQASSDGGATWLAANARVNGRTGGVGKAELPSLATDGSGKVFIVWRDARTGRPEAWVNTYDFNATGAKLGTAQQLSSATDAASVKAPVVAADAAGNVHVLFTELPDDAAKNVKGVVSTDGGASFSAEVSVSQPPAGSEPDADTPAIAVRDGVAIAAWEDTRAGKANIYAARFSGGEWGEPVKADGGGRGEYRALEPQVALGAGNRVFVAYRGFRGTGANDAGDVFANFSDAADALIFQPNDLRLDQGFGALGAIDSFSPHLVTRGAGNEAVVVWLDNRDGANADPYAALIDFP